ncbi:MAG: type II secretion system F family protein [Acidilobus sp.]
MMRRKLSDPRLYGPLAITLNKLNAISAPLSVAAFTSALLSRFALHLNYAVPTAFAAFGALFIVMPALARKLAMSLLGSGIDDEMPALLAVMIPYVASSRDLASVLTTAAESLKLRFVRNESRRLQYLLSAGYDERRALRILADTTPSARLRDVLRELLAVEELGLSRARAATELYSRTMDAIKVSWQSYAKLGETITEAITTIIVSAAVLLPLSFFGNADLLMPLAVLVMVLSPSLAMMLAMLRPRLGEPDGSWWVAGLTISSTSLASLLLFLDRYLPAALALLATSIISEASWIRLSRRVASSLRLLREASERARLGLPFGDVISRASVLGKSVVQALLDSDRVAGRIGVGPAIQGFADILYESLRSLRSLQVEAYVLMGVSAVAPAIALAGVYAIANYISSSSLSLMLSNVASVTYASRLLLAISPLSTLPTAALYRGRRMSSTPSLVALLLSLAALHVMHL